MQQNLLVTVQGTRRKLDIELPGDVPVHELIPVLLEMCNQPSRFAPGASRSKTAWTLHIAQLDQPLKTTQTLADAGVLDGDILLLQERSTSQSRSAQTRNRGSAQTVEASAQTGMIGVEWKKDWPL
jgi:uncharacterized ubiquitin-like protein YukD